MKSYHPSPTILKLFKSIAKVQLLLGPIGGGKTTGVLMKLLMLSQHQRPNKEGIRKTRWAVVRNTRPQLRDSVLKTVWDWLPPNGDSIVWRETDMTLVLNYKLPDDTWVHSEWLFRALDREGDAQRLLSVEFTGVWLSEFREIPLPLLIDALSRTGRYPNASDGGPSWRGILGESNMPSKGSDWHRFMELERPEHVAVFKQPSALSPEAENLQYLEPDYYSLLMHGSTKSWQQAHITCEYPDAADGRTVWGDCFVHDRHVAKEPLLVLGQGPLAPCVMVGVDQGRQPAAVIGQVGMRGRLEVQHELWGENMAMDRFLAEHLRPLLAQKYPGMPVLAVIDPAGTHRGQANDVTPADVLEGGGIKVVPAPTNALDRRLSAVERLFLQHDGILIDPGCKQLIAACSSDYRFQVKRDGSTEVTPEKLHPISDLADALQYLALAVAGGNVYGRVIDRMRRRVVGATAEAPPVRGWT